MDLSDRVVRAPLRAGTRRRPAGSRPRRSVPAPVSAPPGPPGPQPSGYPAGGPFPPPGLGIIRSRTGNGRNVPALSWARRSSRNPCTPICSSTSATVRPSTPACPGPGVARDPVACHDQRRRVVHEVEQVVEPATRIGRRPTVKLGLHLRYPPPPIGRSGEAPAFTGASFGIAASSLRDSAAALPHVPGSPGLATTTAAPPRPDPIGRRWTQPRPPRRMRGGGRGPGRFPCSLTIRSTKEEPSSAPAASPWLPRSTSPRPPGRTCTSPPGVPHPEHRDGCAPHPAHIRQIGAGGALRGVLTLVPLVLLSVTLAGPAPSGSTGTSRLCRGCSHPHRHLPAQAAPSFTALLRQGRRSRSLTSTRTISASRRTWIRA